jgi:hypothetical protein
MDMNQELIDRVLDEIVRDVEFGDLTAIEELLRAVPEAALIAYLPDNEPPEPEFPEPTGKLLRDYTIDDLNPKMKHWSDN